MVYDFIFSYNNFSMYNKSAFKRIPELQAAFNRIITYPDGKILLVNSSGRNVSLPSLPQPNANIVIEHEKLEAFGCLLSEEHYFLISLNS